MIDIIKQTPIEYSKQSRDYQVLARLYSALFNVSKMYIDNMHVWDNDIDNKLTLLRAKTMNFQPQHQWDLDDLEAITSCFKYLVKNKGTVNALKYCINILMKIKNISGEVDENTVSIYDPGKNNTPKNHVIFRLEQGLITVGIVEDLIKYLLPSGFTYRIYQSRSLAVDKKIHTDIEYRKDTVSSKEVSYSKKMYIGDSRDKIRYTDETFVYDNNTMHIDKDPSKPILPDD